MHLWSHTKSIHKRILIVNYTKYGNREEKEILEQVFSDFPCFPWVWNLIGEFTKIKILGSAVYEHQNKIHCFRSQRNSNRRYANLY